MGGVTISCIFLYFNYYFSIYTIKIISLDRHKYYFIIVCKLYISIFDFRFPMYTMRQISLLLLKKVLNIVHHSKREELH